MKLSTLATLAALTVPSALAQSPAQQIVNAINTVADISQNTNNALSPLSTSTPPDQVATMGATLVDDFKDIISNVTADITMIQATAPITDPVDGQMIVDALDDFVTIHQALLGTVIGKHGILAQFQVTAPVAAVLETLEGGVDSLADALINTVPTEAGSRKARSSSAGSSITDDKNDLDAAIGNTIDTYNQICAPTPLYPEVMPACVTV